MGLYLPHKFHLIEHIYTIRDKTGHKKKIQYPFLSRFKFLITNEIALEYE